jgi:hypothetical protein
VKELRLTPRQVRDLDNRDYLDLLAMYRLEAERANRVPVVSRKPR